jgi:hypothetical protein
VWPHLSAPRSLLASRSGRRTLSRIRPDQTLYEINGNAFPGTGALEVALGDFVEITFVNETKLDHPMHLHARPSRFASDGVPPAGVLVKDTVVVAQLARVTIGFKADDPGWWMLHCHIVHHSLGFWSTLGAPPASLGWAALSAGAPTDLGQRKKRRPFPAAPS